MLDFLENTVIVTGHYGTGKTNLAINLAVDLNKSGKRVTLADLDVVNPYFRSADFMPTAIAQGMSFVASEYVNTNIDIPALSPALDAKIGADGTLIIDVGGDDAGAYALGRYSKRLMEKPYAMLYVINAYRFLTRKPEEALVLLREIEAASRVKVTHIVNNSNLSTETSPEDVLKSADYAEKVAREAEIPLAFTSVRRDIYEKLPVKQGYYPVDIYVSAPWA